MSQSTKTRTDYRRPYRPLPIRFLNALPGLRSDRALFDPERLLASARKKSGEDTLSDAPLMEPLERLCAALVEEARLSRFGRIVQETRLKTLLVNRLRLDALMRKHPEILEQPDPDVLLIAGLARTGTTLLHRSLAADPTARSLPSWEAMHPAPLPGEPYGETAKRLSSGQSAQKMMGWLAPDFAAVHPVSAEAPEEDILLLDLTMMSQTAEAVTRVPSYSTWLETVDHRPAYAYLRDVMKTLQWLSPGQGKSTHWVLKSPHHAEQVPAILDVFPKATIIRTHRDPLKTMGSCASLMCHTHGLSTDHVDPVEIGAHWLRKSERMARIAMETMDQHPERKAVDVYYKDLIADPAGEIDRIYATHGSPLTDSGKTAVIAAAKTPRPHGEKRHAYALSDFGFTPDMITSTFASYIDRFDIPAE